MPNILKRFSRAKVQRLSCCPEAEELPEVRRDGRPAAGTGALRQRRPWKKDAGAPPEEAEKEPQPGRGENALIAFAKIQAEAIVDDARRQAAEPCWKKSAAAGGSKRRRKNKKTAIPPACGQGYAEGHAQRPRWRPQRPQGRAGPADAGPAGPEVFGSRRQGPREDHAGQGHSRGNAGPEPWPRRKRSSM